MRHHGALRPFSHHCSSFTSSQALWHFYLTDSCSTRLCLAPRVKSLNPLLATSL
jgi:hypothetical protein